MNAISLFSGVGGLDIGVNKAGFEVKVAIENDPNCVKTLLRNLKETKIISKDIRKVTKEEILAISNLKEGELDLLFGGPPCQSFSSAGKMKSIHDERGSLIFEYLRLVKELHPKTLLFENVKQFRYIQIDNTKPKPHYSQRDEDPNLVINHLIKKFKLLGYNITFRVVNSADYGVPQKRERTIILGTKSKNPIFFPEPTHSKDDKKLKKWRVLGEVIKNLKQNEVHITYDDKRKKFLKLIPPGGFWKSLPIELQKEAMGEKLKLGGGKTGFFRRLSYDLPSPTLCTSPKQPGTDMCHPEKLRPLSVEEYSAIQEFPENWIFEGDINQKYKQIGNAVPVRLAFVLASQIKNHLENLE